MLRTPMSRIVSRSNRAIWRVGVVIVVLIGGASIAIAQEPSARLERARQLFLQGQAAFQKGSLQQALDRFRAAEKLVPSAELAYNIGHLLDLMGEPEEAAAFLRLYLSRSRESISDRERVEQRIARLRRQVRREREMLIGSPPHLTAEARAFFQRGVELFEQKRYREALAALLAARRLFPAPEIDYNLALISEKLGQRGDAVDYYRVYLRAVEEPDEREAIEGKIRQLEAAQKKGGKPRS
jgi:tetratricopeptide (TPR) repeat protein